MQKINNSNCFDNMGGQKFLFMTNDTKILCVPQQYIFSYIIENDGVIRLESYTEDKSIEKLNKEYDNDNIVVHKYNKDKSALMPKLGIYECVYCNRIDFDTGVNIVFQDKNPFESLDFEKCKIKSSALTP